VDWMELGNLLIKLFANLARSENRPLQRPLSDSDLEYLRKKLDIDTEGTDGNIYTFSQFAKVKNFIFFKKMCFNCKFLFIFRKISEVLLKNSRSGSISFPSVKLLERNCCLTGIAVI
jgi:hypothetical protein